MEESSSVVDVNGSAMVDEGAELESGSMEEMGSMG